MESLRKDGLVNIARCGCEKKSAQIFVEIDTRLLCAVEKSSPQICATIGSF
jgi:hypothetical protein